MAHYKFDGKELKNEHYHVVAYVNGNEIKDEHYRRIATLNDVKKDIEGPGNLMHLVALWLFFVPRR